MTFTVSYFVTLLVTVIVSYLEQTVPKVSKIKISFDNEFVHNPLFGNSYVNLTTPKPAFLGSKSEPFKPFPMKIPPTGEAFNEIELEWIDNEDGRLNCILLLSKVTE